MRLADWLLQMLADCAIVLRNLYNQMVFLSVILASFVLYFLETEICLEIEFSKTDGTAPCIGD